MNKIFLCSALLLFTILSQVPANAEDFFVLSRDNGSLLLFDTTDSGASTPKREIDGAATTLTNGAIYGIFLKDDELFASDESQRAINVFAATDNGDIAPKRRIIGASTGMSSPRGLFISGTELFVVDESDDSIAVFNVSDSGNIAPKRKIKGGNTGFINPCTCFIDGNDLYVLDQSKNLISVFNKTDNGNISPKRTFSVAGGLFDARGLWIDSGVIYIGDGNKNRITSFPISSSGETSPTTEIKGTTDLASPYGLIVKDGYIYASSHSKDKIFVFKTSDTGSATPQRTITSAKIDGPIQMTIAVGGFVKKSEHQQSGVNLTITDTTENATTSSEVHTAFRIPSNFELNAPMGKFTATVSSNGANGVFRFNSTSLNGTVKDVKLIKCYESTGTYKYFGNYAPSADPDTDGTWWLEDANDAYIPADTILTGGTNYYVNYVVKDNGPYDVNPTNGIIEDPAALGTQSSPGGGCVMNPVASFGIEWLLLGFAALAGFIRKP